MSDRKSVSSWLTFAGWVLVVAVLYWGRAVLMPIALAALLSFVLAGPVTRLQRWVGRTIAAILGKLDLAFEWMDTAVTERDPQLIWNLTDPDLAPLRPDPRFRLIRQRMKLEVD